MYKGATQEPRRSTSAIRATAQERSGIPWRAYFCCRSSAFSRVMSTPDGQSPRHPLHDRQLSSTSVSSGDSKMLVRRLAAVGAAGPSGSIPRKGSFLLPEDPGAPAARKTGLFHPHVRISRMTFERARVVRSSSPDTRYAGQIVPPDRFVLRQSPLPLHCSTEHRSACAFDRTPLTPGVWHSSKTARQL